MLCFLNYRYPSFSQNLSTGPIKSEKMGWDLQTVGSDVQSIFVEELGRLSKHEIFGILFKDLVEAALDVDWREFFPYLKWIPNKTLERRIEKLNFRRQAVMMALIKEQSKRVTSEEVPCLNFAYCL